MSNSRGLSISLVPLAMRRMNGVKTVSSGAVNRTIPQAEFEETLRRYQQEALSGAPEMINVVRGLWRSEGLATTFGKFRLRENTLNDPLIPGESQGIAHVGYGAASNEYAHFDTNELREIVETKCHPDYKGFAYEGMGSILRIYEPGIFKWMCGTLGLIPKNAPPGPDKAGFFEAFFAPFPAEVRRLITHGYGRLIAFSRISVYKAIDEARSLPQKHVLPAVQGIAFAFAMMNSQDMPRLLENSAIDYPAEIRGAFQEGLVYGLVFCEWFVPGFLASWKCRAKLEEKLVARARAEASGSLRRGYPLPFALEKTIAAAGL